MKFGRVPVDAAAGGILAHTLKLSGGTLRKGKLLDEADAAAIRAAGIPDVVVARLEPGELGEDAAAGCVAAALAGEHLAARPPATGRCNLHAACAGLLIYEAAALEQVNLVDEAVTVAVLPPYAVVAAGQLVATVKIIPYGVAGRVVDEAVARATRDPLSLRPFVPRRAGLIQTLVGGGDASGKTVRVTTARLERLGSRLEAHAACAHREDAIAAAIDAMAARGCDLILIAGASATTDRGDVVPQGIVRAGGRVLHLGMPVEPGNLLVLAESATGTPVICLPGCARSPALNGFDWVLERLAAAIPVRGTDIMRMGAGGLIKTRDDTG